MHLASSPYTSNAVDKIMHMTDFPLLLLSLSSAMKNGRYCFVISAVTGDNNDYWRYGLEVF